MSPKLFKALGAPRKRKAGCYETVNGSVACESKSCMFFAWCGTALGWGCTGNNRVFVLGKRALRTCSTSFIISRLHRKSRVKSNTTTLRFSATLPYRCVPRAQPVPLPSSDWTVWPHFFLFDEYNESSITTPFPVQDEK